MRPEGDRSDAGFPPASARVHRPDESRPRRPYRSPSLIEYGSVRRLTRSGGATRIEVFFGRRRMRF